jgi:hypothetical protein
VGKGIMTQPHCALLQSRNIDEPRLALPRSRVSATDSTAVQADTHQVLFEHAHVSIAEHAPFDLPIINEAFVTSLSVLFVFIVAGKVFGVIPVAAV